MTHPQLPGCRFASWYDGSALGRDCTVCEAGDEDVGTGSQRRPDSGSDAAPLADQRGTSSQLWLFAEGA